MQTKFSTPTTYYKATAFAGTFAFLPTLEPTQKKQKSQQATAQGHSKPDTTVFRPKRSTTGNTYCAKKQIN